MEQTIMEQTIIQKTDCQKMKREVSLKTYNLIFPKNDGRSYKFMANR